MKDKIVVIDFAGTLIKAEIIEEANKFRSKVLQRALPKDWEHSDPEKFYKVNREFVEKLTNIKSNMKVKYRKNDGWWMELNGKQVQNQISTNLFQIGMYMAAKKYGKNIIPEGLIEQLKKIKNKRYKLAIVTGVRIDIVSGMLQIAKIPFKFDYIYGQPPILGMNQIQFIKDLRKKGSIKYIVGDKKSDLERIPKVKKIFVTWGHPTGGEEKFADFTINKPKELGEIIK